MFSLPRRGSRMATYRPTHVNIPIDPFVLGAANRMYYGNLAMIVGAALWGATESVAAQLHYPKALDGQMWGRIHQVYYPWSILWPWSRFPFLHLHMSVAAAASLRNTFVAGYAIVVFGLVFGFWFAARARKRYLDSPKKTKDYHGSARWATALDLGGTEMLPPDHWASDRALKTRNREFEARRKDLKIAKTPQEWRSDPGVFVAEWYDEKTASRFFLRDVSDKHIGLYAPTRGGKGVSVIVPAMLSWSASAVVNDPKGEIYQLTSGFRKHALKQRIFRFDPLCEDGTGARINFLDFVRLRTEFEVADAENLALIICDPQGQGLDNGDASDHWKKTSVAFLTGVILHVLYATDIPKEKKNLAGVDDFLNCRPWRESCEIMQQYPHDPSFSRGWTTLESKLTATCPTVLAAAANQIARPPNEAGSVISSMQGYLTYYRDPIIARNTAVSDFSIEDLMYAKQAATLYLINNPNMMERIRPIIRLVVNSILTTFCGAVEFDENSREKKAYQHKLLMVMDEFTSTLSKMSIFANGISFVAGYGIKLLIVVQDLAQLASTYGENMAQAITSNLHTEIFFSTKNEHSADEFTKMLGSSTLRMETRSWQTSMGFRSKPSISESFIARPLLTVSEIQTMPDTEMVVMVTNTPPVYARKLRYYDEPFLKKRLMPPVHSSDRVPRDDQAFFYRLEKRYRLADAAAAERRSKALPFEAPASEEAIASSKISRLLAQQAASADAESNEEAVDLTAMF